MKKSREGRQTGLPSLTGLLDYRDTLPNTKVLGYFRCVAI